MWIEYLSSSFFGNFIPILIKCCYVWTWNFTINEQTHSIIFESYYWVMCDTCGSWNSYFGEFHGTFHILSIIGLNKCWFMFFFLKKITRNIYLNSVFVRIFYDMKHYNKFYFFYWSLELNFNCKQHLWLKFF
jgi:hypothetical protein